MKEPWKIYTDELWREYLRRSTVNESGKREIERDALIIASKTAGQASCITW